jgi:hypothetical protein
VAAKAVLPLYFENGKKKRGEMQMRLKRVVLGMSLVLLTSTAASADIAIATGAVYGGPATHLEVCYLYNAGLVPVTIKEARITGENGPTYWFTFPSGPIQAPTNPPSPIIQISYFNTCGNGTLQPGYTCGVAVIDNTNQAWSCRFQTVGGTPDIRGVLVLRDVNNNVLINANLSH